MQINCEFEMCIYNKDSECELDSIKIGAFGNCEAGITPVIPADTIQHYKDYTRSIIEKRSK